MDTRQTTLNEYGFELPNPVQVTLEVFTEVSN